MLCCGVKGFKTWLFNSRNCFVELEGLPVQLWGLDPLYWTHVKLFVIDVLELAHYPGFQDVFAISNHPIVKAAIIGYVVEVDRKEKLTIYEVDDGTASIPCCHWVNEDEGSENKQQTLNLGDLVTVLGKITTYREKRQITISTVCIEKDPNAETLHWLEVLNNKEIYNKPFEVPNQFNPKAKIANKHWLKTPLDVEIDSLEQTLKIDIADYLESANTLSFATEDLCGVGKLRETIETLSRNYKDALHSKETGAKELKESSGEISTVEIKTIIRQALKKLEKDGVVYCKNVLMNETHFEFISVKNDLSPRILRVIQDVTENEGESSGGGVPKSKIMSMFKSMEKYKYVRRDRVTLALNHLISSGDIYETRDEHYRRV